MGLPINKISVAVNDNDILHRFFSSNDYSKQLVHETISPSMDISVASNFERLVYDFFLNRDSSKCAKMFDNFPIKALIGKLSNIFAHLEESLFKKKSYTSLSKLLATLISMLGDIVS